MSHSKPLDVVILVKKRDCGTGDSWEPYQEYSEKTKASTNDWSCYILAKEGETFSVRCTNTTKKLLAFRISVDACHVQQYLLRPKGEAGDTVTCRGTGSHSMMFHLISALTRVGNKHSRPPSEAGCINITAYQSSGAGRRLPPPAGPTEQLGLPVSMDGTLWTLCVRLTGSEMVIGELSPHAAEISGASWKQFASLDFNYRTEDELRSGRIRGVKMPPKPDPPSDWSTLSSVGKRKRESTSNSASRKRLDELDEDELDEVDCWAMGLDIKSPPSPSNYSASSGDTVRVLRSPAKNRPPRKLKRLLSSQLGSPTPELDPSSPLTPWTSSSLQANSVTFENSPRNPTSQALTESSLSSPSAARSTEPAADVVSSVANPIELPPPQPSSPYSQLRHPAVAPTITSLSTPHDSSELERSTSASISEADRAVVALAAFLDEVSPFRPLGLSTKDLQEAGILTLAELRIIAHKPEVFRTKISVLADLRERDRYLWMMFRKGLKKLTEGDRREQSAGDPIHESGPVRKFVRSLCGGECIDSEALVSGLRGAGISSEEDLLVLSRNLEKYTKNIPFLREFATSKKFGWTVFQVGLESLTDRKASTSIQTQDYGSGREGRAFVKWFLDTIDLDKPLGYLTDSFIKEGLNDRVPLLHVAEDIEIAVDSIPFLQGLASGDQLIWAMILVGFENLVKSV